jgi:hypothetical protein
MAKHFRVILTTSGCSMKLIINTGRPHSGLMDCHGRHKTFITHRLQVEFRGAGNVFVWGEKSLKTVGVNTLF